MPTITVPEPKSSALDELLENIAHRAFAFFWNESHPDTGLTKDRAINTPGKTDTHTIASIAATGYALASLTIAVERKWIDRPTAADRALLTLRFIHDRLPNEHGFHYHFVDWRTGEREWKCELSSIDTALLLNGVLVAGRYFDGEAARIADDIYARVDWPWMQNRKPDDPPSQSLSMGWKPETGFLDAQNKDSRWSKYNEASYLYLLAMGAPRYSLPPETWDKWDVSETTLEGFPVFGEPGPLFFAQMTPAYYDLRGKRDRKNRDWWKNFENAHRANRAYCVRNAGKFKTYREGFWGITACDQPPPVGYGAQDPKDGANDGTVAPTAMIAGILFLPEIVRKDATNLYTKHRDPLWGKYGFGNAFNVDKNWYDTEVLGLDFGMMLLALENQRSGLIWKLMGERPDTKKGLAAAGFRK